MQSLSRRHFLAASGVGIAAAALPADPLSLPIGCQTYPVRDALGKDLNGTQVPVGKGVVDWTKLFAAAKRGREELLRRPRNGRLTAKLRLPARDAFVAR